jgi:tripartite-type tricarboxylate transporter receptor subunit TctC
VLDILPRIVAEKLAARWGQPVIVENRPGGANLIGTEAVMSAAPDGYTLLVAPPGPLVINPYFFPKPGYDPSVLVPVTLLAKLPPIVVANAKRPFATLPALIGFAKANPGKLTYGSPGASSAPQLAMERLIRAVGINLIHVPYPGGLAPAERDLIAGHIDVMFDVIGNAWPHIQDGDLRALAVGTGTRLPELPDIPAIAETIPGYVHNEWFAVLAPPKTPPEIVSKLSLSIAETLKMPDVAKRFSTFHVVPIGSSPGETAAFIKSEDERWRQLSVSMSIKPQPK